MENNRDFHVEPTKLVKHHEVKNDKCWNFYFIQYGRIYNQDKTRYRKFTLLVWFDIFDVQDYADSDKVTDKDIRNYAAESAMNICDAYIKSYNDTKEFYDFCNKEIDNYNKGVASREHPWWTY